MEYFFYCRDKPGSAKLLRDDELAEAHWSFMDGYSDAMIARGPTLNEDRTVHTGSMHVVDLPDLDAAKVFAYEEPFYRAGVYSEVLIRRWRNALGRSMWDFQGPAGPRFLIIGHARPGMTQRRDGLLDKHRRYFAYGGYLDHLVARGPLLSDDGTQWRGSALIVQLRDRAAVDAMLAAEPYGRAGLYAYVEVHDWQPGGRPAN